VWRTAVPQSSSDSRPYDCVVNPAIPRGGVDSCGGTRVLRDIEIIIATRFADHYAVIYTVTRTRRDELDDRAPQFRSHPNCTVARIVIVTSMEVELVLISGQDRYSKRRHERLVPLFSLQSSCDSLLVQMNHASYSDMPRIGATCADKMRILSKVNKSSLGHYSLTFPGVRLFCSNMVNGALVVRSKSGCIDMKKSIWAPRRFFVGVLAATLAMGA
jgi:hypothetical protein